ncbi:MAG: NDP-hexose 2,3-dehydratase family protein, partial [Vicingaceae bacterium]|nr:NDP-hexose 2,3-dehydratase family protein [Vicingaceae bacterium]
MNNSIEHSFLRSALTLDNPFISSDEFLNWLEEKKASVKHKITPIPFSEMENWGFNDDTGNLEHDSGKFFSIEGINVKTNWGNVPEWSQPIINQPEIGFLGIITKKIDGVLSFLMQAKIEPGNINAVQLSPTLQATKSNYTQVHKGNPPLYLEYFLEEREDVTILLDQLQSEQGKE